MASTSVSEACEGWMRRDGLTRLIDIRRECAGSYRRSSSTLTQRSVMTSVRRKMQVLDEGKREIKMIALSSGAVISSEFSSSHDQNTSFLSPQSSLTHGRPLRRRQDAERDEFVKESVNAECLPTPQLLNLEGLQHDHVDNFNPAITYRAQSQTRVFLPANA